MILRGVGIGSIYFGIGNTGKPNPSSAFVEVLEDGSVSVLCGAADMGQGSTTTLAQIVASELSVSVDRVVMTTADTGTTPDSGVSSASRQTYASGNACRLAAAQARETLLDEAARTLFCESRNQLVLEDGVIRVMGDPHQRLSVADVVAACRAKGQLVVSSAAFNPPTTDLDHETGQGTPYATYAFGTQTVEVEVDTETGEVTILSVRAVHDVGRAINPQSAEGQIEGGVAMGCGYATMEEVVVEKGNVHTRTFVEYSIPTALDVPPIEPVLVEEPAPSGPFGAKGLGEPPTCATAAAVLNAVYAATGVRMTRLPLTAENVYLALGAAGYRDGIPPTSTGGSCE
ncbi:MAG: molybdopterin-dependent oxidoreductase [Actinobacteria bacterium]|nr:molybdopterin-dependent oxidoreductase [Actinomycetota bacterium]